MWKVEESEAENRNEALKKVNSNFFATLYFIFIFIFFLFFGFSFIMFLALGGLL